MSICWTNEKFETMVPLSPSSLRLLNWLVACALVSLSQLRFNPEWFICDICGIYDIYVTIKRRHEDVNCFYCGEVSHIKSHIKSLIWITRRKPKPYQKSYGSLQLFSSRGGCETQFRYDDALPARKANTERGYVCCVRLIRLSRNLKDRWLVSVSLLIFHFIPGFS